ncbi:RagB/SusD family nutrient uptake outer membrane protein [Chitinophaga vietnamensis]|uniref:RagB/SusD family nutrient uptake outer membrane protein n=1 Tax=Chitinophaga vietnamensis TaxID=2593957 RepID=UPI00117796E1|nr:RagB/SusD family nutrient uptake outer membrane protein [Chitinophaga vietnamensis]
MKQYLIAAALLSLVACAKNDNTPPSKPPANDTTKLEIAVYDATAWDASNPYGQLRAGVNVSIYLTQDDYYAQKPVASGQTDAGGKATFSGIAAADYYIVAQLDTLSNFPGRINTNPAMGYTFDSLYQQFTVPARVNELFPYPGNFIYKDLNADGVLDSKDMVKLPAEHIHADSARITRKRVLIGVADNVNYQPFATAQQLKDAVDNLYNEVHTWHQLHATIDGVYTDDADCSALPAYCPINNYQLTSTDTRINTLWQNAYMIISKANRIFSYAATSPVSKADVAIYMADARAVKAYMYLQLVNMFGSVLNYNTIAIPMNVSSMAPTPTRMLISALLKLAILSLPHLSPTANRSHLSSEACNILALRNELEQNNYSTGGSSLNSLYTPDSLIKIDLVKNGAYNNPLSQENIWCDSRPISNQDLKAIFNKGNYAPEIHLADALLLQAELFTFTNNLDDALRRVNILRARNGSPIYPIPTTKTNAEVVAIIQQQYRDDLAIEGLTFNSLKRWQLLTPRLAPLGFKPNNSLLPIPQQTINIFTGLQQNPGY